ncbi:MAG TPA: ROK family protein [Armatimonadota bacterium]|nr:ROK family protein [Armatimonadota bacterium]
MKHRLIIGFDIGGTKSSVILATSAGEIIGRISAPTEIPEGPLVTVNRLINDARKLMEQHNLSKEDVAGVGICCGGPLDRETGIILGPPNAPGWDYVPVVSLTTDALGIPAVLENDADCIALAEFYFGAGKGKKNVVAFTWGTGVGSGIVINGRLYSGTKGMAGEIGHVTYLSGGRPCGCGKLGCIEAYASGSSIARMAAEQVQAGRASSLSGKDLVDTQSVCDAARAGDELALEVLKVAARAMGRAVSIAAHVLNPEVIALGTMAVKAGDLLMPEVLNVVEAEVWPQIRETLEIVPSPLGDRIQDLAAISAFLGRSLPEFE